MFGSQLNRLGLAVRTASFSAVVNPLVWAAGSSEYMVTGQGSHEFLAQYMGEGTPSFTNSAMLLPDFEGVYQAIPANSMPVHGARWDGGTPYTDDAGGAPLSVMPSLYAAPAYTNLLEYSNDLTNAGWAGVGTQTTAFTEDGLTGAPNTATLATDTGGSYGSMSQGWSSAPADTHVFRVFLLKDTDETRFVGVEFNSSGFADYIQLHVNSKTGAAVDLGVGTYDYEINSAGLWWEVIVSVTLGSVKDMDCTVYPAVGTTIGTVAAAATGSATFGNLELHSGKTIPEVRGAAPIITAASTVTTSAVFNDYTATNQSNTEGGYYCEFTNVGVNGNPLGFGLLGLGASGRMLYSNSNQRISSWDGTTSANSPVIDLTDPGKIFQVGMAYGDSLKRVNVDDVWGTEVAYDGEYAAVGPTLFVLRDDATQYSPEAVMLLRNIQRWNLPYADAKTKMDELMA